MGLNLLGRCASSPYASTNNQAIAPKGDNFKVTKWFASGEFLIVEINYPNATNYEGNKIVVYKGVVDLEDLLEQTNGILDPHFTDKSFSPIARFEPTPFGRQLAKMMVDGYYSR